MPARDERSTHGRPRLYVVALSHLDTQWRWTVRETVRDFLPRTVRENESRFIRFPGYLLSFEGAHRYRLLAETDPELLAVVRRRVAEGRWFPAGAAWEAFDVNLPGPESIVRQILLGRLEFERVVGRASDDLFLPDCFGFPASLPTLATHCGIVGFSTQKLRRGAEMRAARGIPFPLGLWLGPDGAGLPAVLDPGEYGAQTRRDLSREPAWLEQFAALAAAGRPAKLQTYQGLGDKGGAIEPETVEWIERSTRSDGPIEVRLASSEAIFLDLSAAERAGLPTYRGDLLLRLHGTGCYTSRSQLKRWHREAEGLALAGERAAALAAPWTSTPIRRARRDALRSHWERVLSHQMHDDLTGTSLPAAYRYSAAALAAALNGFAEELEEAVETIASTLDTDTEGQPIAVFNPLGRERTELVDVRLLAAAAGEPPPRIFDPAGRESPSQWRRVDGGWRGCFEARLPALSVAIFEARSGPANPDDAAALGSGTSALVNELYELRIDERGDLGSWIDRRSGRELLASPAGVELLADRSERFPSWEIRYEDLRREPFARLDSPVEPSVIESGPLRRRLRIRHSACGSTWTRDYMIAGGAPGGAAEIAEIDFRVDWRTDGAVAKADFPLAWSFPEAIYDQGIGVAHRPVSSPDLYEVPAQSFAAAPRAAPWESAGGAVVLSDVKQGWDHPDAHRLRLTLLHTPRIGRRFRYQRRQDFGAHRFRIGLAHLEAGAGIERLAELGERFRHRLRAFFVARGAKGSARLWAPIQNLSAKTLVSALKPAEKGDRLVLRLHDASGTPHGPQITLSSPLRPAEEMDGAERPLSSQTVAPSTRPMRPFELRTLALDFDSPVGRLSAVDLPLELARDVHATSDFGERARCAGIDGRGRTLPRRLLPGEIVARGVIHDLSPLHRRGEPSALRSNGQRIDVPAGFRRLSLLVGSFGAASEGLIGIGDRRVTVSVPDGLAPSGRFDELSRLDRLPFLDPVRAGYLLRLPQRWIVPHLHDRRGRIDACRAATLYGIEIALDERAGPVMLPDCPSLLLFAATASRAAPPAIRPLSPLFEGERADD